MQQHRRGIMVRPPPRLERFFLQLSDHDRTHTHEGQQTVPCLRNSVYKLTGAILASAIESNIVGRGGVLHDIHTACSTASKYLHPEPQHLVVRLQSCSSAIIPQLPDSPTAGGARPHDQQDCATADVAGAASEPGTHLARHAQSV